MIVLILSGSPYGSFVHPIDKGSGGGGSGGGPGGGLVFLNITRTLHVDGDILAEGATATTPSSGGGSGGSIYVNATNFSGHGRISVQGGGATTGSGAGSGGRMAVKVSRLFEFSGETSTYGGISGNNVDSDSDFNGAGGTVFLEYVEYTTPPSEEYYEGRLASQKLFLNNKNRNHDLPTMLFQEVSTENITLDLLEAVNHVFLELDGSHTELIVHKFDGDRTGLMHLRSGQKLYSEYVASTTGYTVAPVSYSIDDGAEIVLPSTVILLGTRTRHAGLMTGVHNLTAAEGATVVFYSTSQTAMLEGGHYVHMTQPGNISVTWMTVQRGSQVNFTNVAERLTLSITRFVVKYEGKVYMNRGTINSDEGVVESLGLLTLAGEGYGAQLGPGAGTVLSMSTLVLAAIFLLSSLSLLSSSGMGRSFKAVDCSTQVMDFIGNSVYIFTRPDLQLLF